MATQPSQTPAKTSQSSILLDIYVPTELQQAHDFQSTAAQADTSRTVNSIDYYKDLDSQLLQCHERDGSHHEDGYQQRRLAKRGVSRAGSRLESLLTLKGLLSV
jgi:hypothetical protein